MCMCIFTCMYISVPCVCKAQRSQKWMLDLLELELQRVASHHVHTGNQIFVLCKAVLITAEPCLQPHKLQFLMIIIIEPQKFRSQTYWNYSI